MMELFTVRLVQGGVGLPEVKVGEAALAGTRSAALSVKGAAGSPGSPEVEESLDGCVCGNMRS